MKYNTDLDFSDRIQIFADTDPNLEKKSDPDPEKKNRIRNTG